MSNQAALFMIIVIIISGCPGKASETSMMLPRSGMLLWLQAEMLSKNPGEAVSIWPDASGQGRRAVFTPVNGKGEAPTFAAHGMAGKPAVHFAGNSALRVDALPLGAYTIAIVFQTTTSGEMLYEHSDGLHSYLMNKDGCYLSTGLGGTVSVKRGRLRTEKDAACETWAAGKPQVCVQTFDGTDDGLQLYRNGVLQALALTNTGNLKTLSTVTMPFFIGVHAYFGTQQLQGDIAELLVYDHALSATEMAQLNNALLHKYGIDDIAASKPEVKLPVNTAYLQRKDIVETQEMPFLINGKPDWNNGSRIVYYTSDNIPARIILDLGAGNAAPVSKIRIANYRRDPEYGVFPDRGYGRIDVLGVADVIPAVDAKALLSNVPLTKATNDFNQGAVWTEINLPQPYPRGRYIVLRLNPPDNYTGGDFANYPVSTWTNFGDTDSALNQVEVWSNTLR